MKHSHFVLGACAALLLLNPSGALGRPSALSELASTSHRPPLGPSAPALSVIKLDPVNLTSSYYPVLTPKDVVGCNGVRGSGKSTFGKLTVDAHQHRRTWATSPRRPKTRVLAFDLLDEWSVHGRPRRKEKVLIGPLHDRVTFSEFYDQGGYKELLRQPDLSLAVVPDLELLLDHKAVGEAFADVARLLPSVGDLLFVCSEVGYYEEHCRKEMIMLATLSRHWDVSLWVEGQVATMIAKKARAQFTQYYTGQQTDAADLDALDDMTKRSPHWPGFADQVAVLPDLTLKGWLRAGPAALGKAA